MARYEERLACKREVNHTHLLLVTTELKVLASLQGELVLCLADGAFETEHNFLGLWAKRRL
jgi:hypothetical protein